MAKVHVTTPWFSKKLIVPLDSAKSRKRVDTNRRGGPLDPPAHQWVKYLVKTNRMLIRVLCWANFNEALVREVKPPVDVDADSLEA